MKIWAVVEIGDDTRLPKVAVDTVEDIAGGIDRQLGEFLDAWEDGVMRE